MKAKLRETGEVVELRQYYCDGTAKGITGDAAVQHYNEWMDKAGMSHLKTK